MRESFSVPLSTEHHLPTYDSDLIDFLTTLFSSEGSANSLLFEALKQEEKEKFGSPEIENLRFELKRFDPMTFKGRLRLRYNLQLTFSCSGLVNQLVDQHSYWNFELDRSSALIHFIGDEYGDLRSTADEF